ncbi:MAG: hypothetical protein JSU63_16290 [Phycisphaerales bacterium]|nr:MAG: hypothetical protein JSU63_16290 [Phycisphaerales bacterium]
MAGNRSKGETLTPSRRRARRTHLFSEVLWKREDDTRLRRGVLVGVSGTGLAMVVDHKHAAKAKMLLIPDKNGHHRYWSKPAVVTRVEQLSDTLDLVAAKYPDADESAPIDLKPTR